MQLYSYFRSSAAYRVRIALNLKGLSYEYLGVHLLKNGGEHLSDSYRDLNPSALVPTLVDGDVSIGQSMAIIEYLDETHPQPALLPADPAGRARVRSIAQIISCDTHPLNNLRVLKYLKHELQASDDARNAWYRHWVTLGMGAVESMLAGSSATGKFCHGDTPSLADLCLVPQVFNARRLDCDLSAMPTVVRIDAACREIQAFDLAVPEKQPDAE
ncbi:maleylacetoacetate isomerase [Bordetella tumulicola]|uniref:maleylacetoacetate isomerase n=1 Tax=Bordetella tumulicola TaxID=1649133 RepID=UPI0039F0E9FF